MNENIRAKIQKLFALAERGVEGEADVAMKKARELMQKHGVTEDDVNIFFVDVPAARHKEKWLIMLHSICGDFSGVASIVGYKSLGWAGDEIGVNVARELFLYLKEETNRQTEKRGVAGRKFKNDFRIGCIRALYEKLSSLGGWRDMEERKRRVMEKHFSKMKHFHSRARSVNGNYFRAGELSAADINLNRQAWHNGASGFIEGGKE